MRSHFRPSEAALMACAVSGATALMTGVCSAQFSAADYATDPTYASGFTEGLNGGYGFGAWSFAQSTGSPVQTGMSSASALGTAWTLYNPNGKPAGTDLIDAGRSIVGGLQIGQTISTTIVNPTQTWFYRGYAIILASGGQNVGYGGAGGVQRLNVGTFEYYTYGRWLTPNGTPMSGWPYWKVAPLLNTDTAPGGMRFDVTLTGADTYSFTMTPLAHPEKAYTESGTLQNSGTIDWIQFQLYNTASTGPDDVTANMYISGVTVVPEPSTLGLLGLAGLLFLRRRQ